MGVDVILNWEENGEEEWYYIFKLSCYPFELQDYEIHDKNCPEELDPIYLNKYLEWLQKLFFFIKHAPDLYMKYNNTSNSLNELKEGLIQDIESILDAIKKSESLTLRNIKNWISVG